MQEPTNTPTAFAYGNNNFDPNSVDAERIVLLSLVVDCSPSIEPFEMDFTRALQEFISEEKNSHISEELFVQLVTFSSDVIFETGFHPVSSIDPSSYSIRHRNGLTSGYDAVAKSLNSMIDYGNQLQGVDVRYNMAIITDGDFNDGIDTDGRTVRNILQKVISKDVEMKPKWSVFMYGVGQERIFRKAKDNMSLTDNALLTYGASGKDFKNMLQTVSQSVSKSSSGTAVPTF